MQPEKWPAAGALALALTFTGAALPAQQPDVDALERQLVALFERPAGTPISAQQKAALGEFVAAHAGRLGRLGYARGLHSYLTRDPDKAVAELDAFFAEHDAIEDAEHEQMAGRIYMSAFVRLARTDDPTVEQLGRWGERATRLYADLALLSRYMPRALAGIADEDVRAAARVALARGALASRATAAAQDGFLRALYGDGEPATATAAAAARRTPVAATDEAARKRRSLTGRTAPELAPELVIDADGGAAAAKLPATKGKVVLVDFWATWCGPCRAVVPDLVALQHKHGAAIQVIGATRFYGYGTDFSGGGGRDARGKLVRDLDRDAEVAINETFAEAFELNYPIAFVGPEVFDRYGVRGIPTLFVIGRDGKVVGHTVGSRSHDELHRLIEAALGAR